MPCRTMITAHAGSEGLPDNSLESFVQMCSCGADAVELDLRLWKGDLILSHNMPEEGKSYVPLARAFEEAAKYPDLMVNVDLKETGLIERTMELARACGIGGRVLFTGDIAPNEIPMIHKRGYTCWYNGSLIPVERRGEAFDYIESLGFEILNTHYSTMPEEMLPLRCRQLSLWTLNTEEVLAKYLKAGVYTITTRLPLAALRLRSELQSGL